MSFLKGVVGSVFGGLLGKSLFSLFKKPKTALLPKPVTRDDAREQAAREDELRKRRGAAADRDAGGGGEPVGGLGRFIPGS